MAMLKVKAGRENWVKDTDAANCSMCMVKFGVLTRKHHCRACGNIFCSSCSSTEISYTPSTRQDEKGYVEKKKRVCTNCFDSINDGAGRTTEAKMIADVPAKGGVDFGSFLSTNMATMGNSFMGNPFIATSFNGKSFQLAFERPSQPTFEKANMLTSSRPESFLGHNTVERNAVERRFSFDQADADAAFLIMQQEEKRRAMSGEVKPVERRFSFDQADADAAFLIMQQEEKRRAMSGEVKPVEPEQEPHGFVGSRRPSLVPTEGSEPGAQQHGAAGEGDWEFDPGRADEEEAPLESTFTFYIAKLQSQKRLLEARLREQGQEEEDDDADPSQVPLETEAAIVDKQFEELVRGSSLHDQAEAEAPEGDKQHPSVANTNRAELLKLSLAVLKLSLKYEYRKKQAPGTRSSARPAGEVRDLTLRD